MTEQEAKNYVKNSSTVKKEEFSYTFTQNTTKSTSVDLFKEAIEALDGWIVESNNYKFYPNKKYHHNFTRITETIACIPSAL